jgi:general secretion pathway protein G
MRRFPASHSRPVTGFTLIELLVVMAIVATLLTIAMSRCFRRIDHSREVALNQSLAVMRDAIDKFDGDQGIFPRSIEALVDKRYLRNVPVDPISESKGWFPSRRPPAAILTLFEFPRARE